MDTKAIVKELDSQIAKLTAARNVLAELGGNGLGATVSTGRRTMSAAARARIAKAQRARWAKARAGKK